MHEQDSSLVAVTPRSNRASIFCALFASTVALVACGGGGSEPPAPDLGLVPPGQIGYMKLVWENAYGKEYALQVSDDRATWSQVRYVTNGSGGTEDFYNLGIDARYVRLQGVGGEALASRNRFAALSAADREALLAFLKSL